jgi:hypothetical protein
VAGKTATLSIKIVGDASQARKGFEDAESAADKFGRGLDKASVAATGALGGIALLAKGAVDAASELEQSTGAIDAVFGDWALDIEQAAQQAASAVGLSTSAYENMATVIGSQLKNAGMNIGDVTNQTQTLIAMGADMASVFGGTAADAVAALSSALKGEMDPIEAYGVTLNQAAVQAQMAADGTDKLEGAAAKQAQTQAVLELITAQTAATQGQWAAQTGTVAEQQQILSARLEDTQAKLGEALLPVMVAVIDKLTGMATWVTANVDTVQKLALGVAALAGTILVVNGAVKVYEAATKVAAAAQWLWNAAMSANPIALVVIAIAAVAAGIYLAYQKFDTFRNIVDTVGRALKTAFDGAKTAISWVVDKIQWLLDKAGSVGSWVGDLFGAPAAGAAAGGGGAARGLYGAPAGAAGRLLGAGSSTAGAVGPGAGRGGLTLAPAGDTYHITVNGALDPDGTADRIQSLLDRRARMTGRAAAGAFA